MNTAILQISDSHFGTEVAPVERALRKLIEELAPSAIIVSGDVTQRARRNQFRAARRFLDSLPKIPILATPGNHDIPMFALATRFLRPYSHWIQTFGTDLEPVLETDRVLVQCVNTTRWFRRKHGQISWAQIERVANRIQRAKPEQLRVVVAHHPLLAIRESDDNNLLRGHRQAVRAWMAAKVDIVMGGHIHLPYIRPLHAEVENPPHRSWVVQAGTAVSKRVREGIPNSVNVLRFADSGPVHCAVERWDYQSAVCAFEQLHSVDLPLTRAELQPEAASSLVAPDHVETERRLHDLADLSDLQGEGRAFE
ncbi:MAG TPA: metallophosphoesterase [Polyangiales bacterium]|nr:metallophosphoesterase [Polyangiales bacterium]